MSLLLYFKDITEIKNIDYEFKRKNSYDYSEGEQIVGTSVSTIQTRQIQKEEKINTVPKIHLDETFKIDVGPFINRPFFVTEVKWESSRPQFYLLDCPSYKLPRDLILSNNSLLNGLKVGSLYRMAGKLNISVAGTITHAGCILVGIIPPLPVAIDLTVRQELLINTILSGPHGFLHANEATSIMLDVPWYCNSDLDTLDFDTSNKLTAMNLGSLPGNFGTLVMMVMNPLQPSAGSSTSLSIVVEANLTNLEVYVPTPRYVEYTPQSYFMSLGTNLLDSGAKYAKKLTGDAIDGLRQGIRYYTGLHNPNSNVNNAAMITHGRNRLNNIDSTTFLEVLDPNAYAPRIVEEPIFNTLEDEMAIGHIIKKRQYIGSFRVNQNDPVGTLLFARPISPYQGGIQASCPGTNNNNIINNNIEALHFLSRAWKGDINIIFQSVMNNKQQVKLRVLQLYNPSPQVTTGTPIYKTILQAPSHLLEFTAGGQEQVVKLPYLCRNQLLTCSRDSTFEALFHGMYYTYVAQPLANSTDSPVDIFFNVYIQLDEKFEFFGYSTERASAVAGPFKTYNPTALRIQEEVNEEDIIKLQSEEITYTPQSIEVMNTPQKQEKESDGKIFCDTNTRLQPLVDVRPLIRRMYHLNTSNSIALAAYVPANIDIPITQIIGENGWNLNNPSTSHGTPMNIISRMYYGKTIGLKMRISIKPLQVAAGSAQPFYTTKVFFVPPQIYSSLEGSGVSARASTVSTGFTGFAFTNIYPLNYTGTNVSNMAGDYVHEFTIPNVNIFKFIGSPSKMIISDSLSVVNYPEGDLGTLRLEIRSITASSLEIEYEVGCTDETRMGFHSIAPTIVRATNGTNYQTPGVGSILSSTTLPPVGLNGYLYVSRV